MNGLELDSSEYAELDPTGRYGRYNEVLGKGASKTVYRAFDEYEGIEVAWNQVKLYDFLQSPQDLERLYSEIHLLKTLNHPNIMKFYTSWVDISNRNINFVTELFTSGTLKQYREKHKRVNIRAVKHWCRQILKGLLYLHSHNPPIIHRDLKCDNIFINGHQGEVKIGDLGLAAFLRKSHAAHCVGTPEFMAPEVYAEEYNELVDIYSFGMCILEMVTFEYPYIECTHPAQIYKKVISGKKPDSLNKVTDPEVQQFVEKCLATVSLRLSAWELLNDPFLQTDENEPDLKSTDCFREINYMDPILGQAYPPLDYEGSSLEDVYHDLSLEAENGLDSIDMEQSGIELFQYNDKENEEHSDEVDITIKGKKSEDGSIFLRLRILDKEGRIRNIYFPFDVESDTALSVATEMVAELDITDQDVTKIADMIDGEVSSLVPKWKQGPGIIENTTDNFANLSFFQNCVSNHSSTGSLINFLLSNRGANSLQIMKGCGNGRFEEITYLIDGIKNSKSLNDLISSRECDNDVWDQYGSLECSSHGSEEYNNEKNDGTLLSHEFSGECDREIEQELRWHRAKFQMELRKLRDKQLGILPKCPKRRDSNSSTVSQSTTNKMSRICEEMVSAENLYAGSLVPNSLHRTTSLPAVNV